MGSIQGLRSEALALRAKEDTNMQISEHLSKVNKTLGGQITQIIDGLQEVISSRTQAYNGLVSKINQSIQGKGGIGDQAILWTFQTVKTMIQVASTTASTASFIAASVQLYASTAANTSAAATAASNAAIAGSSCDAVSAAAYTKAATDAAAVVASDAAAIAAIPGQILANAGSVANAILQIVAIFANTAGLKANINSAIVDYEKMVSQLGYSGVEQGTDANPPHPYTEPIFHGGAVKMVALRDSVMPRYKPVMGYNKRGFVGTLRRI